MEEVVSAVSELVSNVGFPIAAFCAMYFMCYKVMRENTQAISELRTVVQSLIEKLEEP